MRWVAFWSLLYVSVIEFVGAVFFLAAAVSTWGGPGDNLRGVLPMLAIACGLTVTGASLLLRHPWAYLLSLVLALGLLAVGAEALFGYFSGRHLVNDGLGLDLGLFLGAPALIALVVLLLPSTWREVGLGSEGVRRV